jgi:hypothetical protein
MRLRSATAQEAFFPHEVLVRIFSHLPRGALAVTPGRVSRLWAAAKAEAWAALPPLKAYSERTSFRALYNNYEDDVDDEQLHPWLPPWYVRAVFPAS